MEAVLRKEFGDEWEQVRDLLPRCVECGRPFARRADANLDSGLSVKAARLAEAEQGSGATARSASVYDGREEGAAAPPPRGLALRKEKSLMDRLLPSHLPRGSRRGLWPFGCSRRRRHQGCQRSGWPPNEATALGAIDPGAAVAGGG